jgi:hypothetical protein
MIPGNTRSLHDHTDSPPTATGRPDDLRSRCVANDATGSPVAGGFDLAAADLGADAADTAEAINPGGSKAGRERLVDALVEPSQPLLRMVEIEIAGLSSGAGRYWGWVDSADGRPPLKLGDRIQHNGRAYDVCDSYSVGLQTRFRIDIREAEPLTVGNRLAFTVGGGL